MHVTEFLETIEELVVVAHRMDLGLHVAQLIQGLHLAGHPGTHTTKLTANMGKALISLIFQW